MDVMNLFENALRYPTQDFKKVIMLGAVLLVMCIPIMLLSAMQFMFIPAATTDPAQFLAGMVGMGFLILIVSIVFGLLLLVVLGGYSLSIMRKTIALDDELPEFEWGEILTDGLKYLALIIAYSIIPTIVAIVLLSLGGFSAAVGDINAFLFTNLFLFLIIFVVAIVFELLFFIATARLAETDSLFAAINVMEIFEKIGQIGWANYIIWIIVFAIVCFISGIVIGVVSIIPILGALVVILIGYPYILMFSARATGLLYNEGK